MVHEGKQFGVLPLSGMSAADIDQYLGEDDKKPLSVGLSDTSLKLGGGGRS